MSSSPAYLASATPEEFATATRAAIEAARAGIAQVTRGDLVGEARLDAYDEAIAALGTMLNLASLVSKVHPDPDTRAAADAAEQELDQVATDISLDRRVYDALREVDVSGADPATRYWVEKTLRDFRRAGVDRDEATRERIRALQEELVGIGQDFARNINSDTRSAKFPVSALAGMPQDWVAAHPPDADGMVTVTTDNPDVLPFLTYSRDAAARETMLRLWRQRGHPGNIDVLRRMLARRHELATLLGYPSWAAYVTEDKMIGTEQAAADFIAEVSAAARERMQRDYAALLARKQVDDPEATTVEPWDTRYLTERVKAEQYDFDSLALRPYFEYQRVKDGLMAICARLFGVSFHPLADATVWHPEVEAYEVREDGALLGRIYLDMHPRPDKFSHAAMFRIVSGKAGRRLPECALVCNLPRPGELLHYLDVRTLFHEFGHLLHHVFGGDQRWAGISGVRTERDFIEAPSQLLEEWTRDPATLATFAVHHETGEPVPAELVERLRAAEEFGTGLWVAQQMFYAALSLELYRRDPAELDPLEVERAEQERHTPFRHMADTWLHLSFGHLDGYSAIYYTYMWSLVIAKDLFTAFDPGSLLASEVARRYREAVLAPGGSAPAADLVRAFLGRDYTVDAFRAWLAK
ncbi:MAG TPA: M3 family metallopeptidase [Natronosporangium sp.]|nr:M3 family metallopeptidase [Natronosporangium sp.]